MKKYNQYRSKPLIITCLFVIISINWFQISRLFITSIHGEIISDITYCIISGSGLYFLIYRYNQKLYNMIESLADREKDLGKLLQEKEVLLTEIHHRVKNNLAIISGLIDLQAMDLDDSYTQHILSTTQRRIKSIALVHEKLYQDYLFSEINFDNYLRDLVQSISDIYDCQKHHIDIELQTTPLTLEMDKAVPLGLLASELITNSFKHAFKENEKGKISIILKEHQDKFYELFVKDTGNSSLPAQTSNGTSKMGLKLIQTLSNQIKAKVTQKTNGGFQTSILFQLHDISYN